MTHFESFIGSLNLRHITAKELLVGLDKGNTLPPEVMWPNIALTAVIVDKSRSYYGRPAILTSAYRDPDYNSKVGGSRRSQHLLFTALDYKVRGVEPKRLADLLMSWRGRLFEIPVPVTRFRTKNVPWAEIDTWHSRTGGGCVMRFAGGVGVYSWGVHLDTRGLNHSWSGK